MIPHFVKFRSDNFTDHKRTPWGGTSIARHIKANLDLNFPPTIGESWEFSATKELPSICDAADNRTFAELLADKNNACYWLSSAHRQAWGQKTPLLVKYIDAKRNLSVQIHPDIDDRSLPVACCGKWEAWLVLRCEPNAGVYLGIKPGTTRQQLYDAANNAHRFEDILQFCPVKCGDLISVPPRIVHALGAGLCVLEPQVPRQVPHFLAHLRLASSIRRFWRLVAPWFAAPTPRRRSSSPHRYRPTRQSPHHLQRLRQHARCF